MGGRGGRHAWSLSRTPASPGGRPGRPPLPASLPAIFYTAAILGPAAGYLIGGALLNIYTDIGRR